MSSSQERAAKSFIERHGLWTDEQFEAAAKAEKWIEERALEVVRLSFADQHGILRGKTVMAGDAARAMRNGVSITTTLLAKDTSHRSVFPVFTAGGGFGMPEMEGGADVLMIADPTVARDNLRFRLGTKVYTLRSFLSAQAVRARNSMDDIDYCSTNNSTVCAVQSISVPVLFAAMGAHYFIRDNERQYDMARSKDKDLIVIEGANHGLTPCTRCEKTPGQYSK